MKIGQGLEQLFFTTVRIEAEGAGKTKHGTGFFFSHKPAQLEGTDQSVLYLVTNKHVVSNAEVGRFFLTRIDADGNPRIGEQIDFELNRFEARWIGHPSSSVDVTVLPIRDHVNRDQLDKDAYYLAIDSKRIPTQEQIDDLSAIEEVTFIGYPSGLYDEVNLVPLARRGTTATPLSLDYHGLPAFLIDASVFPGSSGSPVFVAGTTVRFGEAGLRAVQRSLFLGVVSGVFTTPAKGKIEIAPIPTNLASEVSVEQMIDIGLAFKSSTVREAVESHIATVGAH